MRIGIDIDNCISNFDDVLLEEYLKHDKELRNTGIINDKPYHITVGMFDWSKEENDDFYYNNIQRIAMSLKPLNNAKEVIDKLKADGNEIYIITSRDNGEYVNPEKMTREWLEKYDIYFDKLILTGRHEKGPVCKENNIDIMIEDSIKNCEDIENNGVKCYIMDTRYNKHETRFERVKRWNEIYSKISSFYKKDNKERINVILDTDTYNECDDQFALSYMLLSQDRFNIEAITVAPYHHDNDISVEEGQEKSYQEILKICNWLNFDTRNKVFKGSNGYIENGNNETNEAVEKIIEIAKKNDKTYIMAIGAITNVALAIKKAPDIINKIEIIWLGGHSPICDNNKEFNFRQDVQAIKEIFESKVDLTIIPCKSVASNLKISIYELEHYLKGKSELCNYLCSRFYNDGIHGIQTRRVIWDISVIAYLINKDWFEEKKMDCPKINKDLSYSFNKNDRKIKFVTYLNSDKIYNDLFNKLIEKG
mgnify:CR=1 FL=1